uniref:C2H2-type domain-containing protein n=1 Tax=Panagrellus redivivus TaxID=6233 RepID=A0A7E4VT63_PANRE
MAAYPRRASTTVTPAIMSRKRPASSITPTLVSTGEEEAEWHTVSRPSTTQSNSATARKVAIAQIQAKIASGQYTTQEYGRHGAEKILTEEGEDTVGRRCSRCHNIFMHDNQHFRDHVNICAYPDPNGSKRARGQSEGVTTTRRTRKEIATKKLIESLLTNRRFFTASTKEDAFKRVGEEIDMPVEDVKKTWQCLNEFLGADGDRNGSDEREDEASNESDPDRTHVASSSTPTTVKTELTEGAGVRSEFDQAFERFQLPPVETEPNTSEQSPIRPNGVNPSTSGRPNAANKPQNCNLNDATNPESCQSNCTDLHRRLIEAKIAQVETETAMIRQRQIQEMELIRQRMKCELEKHELEMKRLR